MIKLDITLKVIHLKLAIVNILIKSKKILRKCHHLLINKNKLEMLLKLDFKDLDLEPIDFKGKIKLVKEGIAAVIVVICRSFTISRR